MNSKVEDEFNARLSAVAREAEALAKHKAPQYNSAYWGLSALDVALDKALQAPEQKERAKTLDIEMVGSTPGEAQARTQALSDKWGALARRIQLKAD